MTELVLNTKARDAVLAFLARTNPEGEGKPISLAVEETFEAPFKQEPVRFSNGVDALPHSSTYGGTKAGKRLRNALNRERNANHDSDDDDDDATALSSDEEVSRAKSVGKRKKKKRQRSKPKEEKKEPKEEPKQSNLSNLEWSVIDDEIFPSATRDAQPAKATEVKEKHEDKKHETIWDVPCGRIQSEDGLLIFEPDEETKRIYQDKQRQRKERAAAETSNGHMQTVKGSSAAEADNMQQWKPRKKRKKRSRQKNLRRDNRPKESLPAHLTEETLRAGRVLSKPSSA